MREYHSLSLYLAMFPWESLNPGIHVDVILTCTSHLNIVTHDLMEASSQAG